MLAPSKTQNELGSGDTALSSAVNSGQNSCGTCLLISLTKAVFEFLRYFVFELTTWQYRGYKIMFARSVSFRAQKRRGKEP